jgi:multimeric flavodoxin WrbA
MANAKVMGISGSPIENSNTDRLIRAIMDATGAEQEFVKLSDIKVGPCTHCRKCAYTNVCVIDDDFRWLAEKVLAADAIVIGSPTIYQAASAYMKAFVERLYSLRHVHLLTKDKIAATAAIGWVNEDKVNEWEQMVLYMAGMDVVGGVTAKGTPGCFVCGPGETCLYSIWNFFRKDVCGKDYGMEKIYKGYLEELPDNDPLTHPSYKVTGYIEIENQPQVMAEAKRIGETIKDRLYDRSRVGRTPSVPTT